MFGLEPCPSGRGKEIIGARIRVRRLQNSARLIKKKIEAGEPWPGKQSQS